MQLPLAVQQFIATMLRIRPEQQQERRLLASNNNNNKKSLKKKSRSRSILLRFKCLLFPIVLLSMLWYNWSFINMHNKSSKKLAGLFDESFTPIPNLIDENNDVIYASTWDAPIVIERYKLLFFYTPKVACTGFKILFHRILGVDVSTWKFETIHRPKSNGLKYLFDYPPSIANRIIQDPTWTRAVFVRNPHEKLVSAFLEKGIASNFTFIRKSCCPADRMCMKWPNQGFADFVALVALEGCYNGHWAPQSARIDSKYLQYINFVGNFETLEQDGKQLLQKIGAWEEYGASGWGPNGSYPIFSQKATGISRSHATKARDNMNEYYTSREVFDQITEYYKQDYENPVLNLELKPPDFLANDSREKKKAKRLGRHKQQKQLLPLPSSPKKEEFRFTSRDKSRVNNISAKRRIMFAKLWNHFFGWTG